MVSYTAPRGDSEFEDISYDGVLDGVIMRGGLGQLVDGDLGAEDFLDEPPGECRHPLRSLSKHI